MAGKGGGGRWREKGGRWREKWGAVAGKGGGGAVAVRELAKLS